MVTRGRTIGLVLSILTAFSVGMAAPAYSQRQDGAVSLFERRPPPAQGFSLRRLFGLEEPPPQQAPAPPVFRKARPKPKVPVVKQERVKPQAANRVAVFGDWLADGLAQGLDDAFAEMANIAFLRRTRGDLGLARDEKGGWAKIAADYLGSDRKVTAAVLMLGMTDRVALADGNVRVEPLSDRWKQLYAARADALLSVFVDRGVPVIWVGLPPVGDEAASAQYAAINAVIRERVRWFGGAYVDIWPGFVDEENRFAATGPDANGEETRLRLGDGMRFTRKGMDKVAHYASVEIRRLLGAALDRKDVPTALPGAGGEPFVEIDKTVSPAGQVQDTGAVQPLTRTDTSPGGLLLKGRTGLEAADALRRTFREGQPAAPVRGRMDDYTIPAQ